MKPIRLEMTAFGSYARLTVVDFQKLEHCLYLITGDTGAGKTTIFDGIMFALYGVASGKGEKKFRTFEMMHCDHVDKSVDTVIRLDFEHMGRDYRVERKYHFKKKRTGEKEYEGTTPQAMLWEPDKEPLEKTDAVTARITELLGMNADQFRKIVMLAQGEFKKFLDADSEEKNQILGELFDNSAYVRFQEIFDRARKKLLQRRREEGEEKIRSAMEAFLLPEDITEEDYEIYTAGHSGLEEALIRLTEKDKREQDRLEEESKKYREEGNRLRETLGKAEEQNRKLEELAGKREMFENLQKKKPDMKQLTDAVDKTERAFHKVMPKQDQFKKAEKAYQDTREKIENLSAQMQKLEKEKEEKKKLLEVCNQENAPVIEQLGAAVAEIEADLPKYDDLMEKSVAWEAERKAEEMARKKREEAGEKREETETTLHALKEQIGELDGIETTVERLRTALDDAEKNLNRLTAKGGIREQAEEIRGQEEALRKEQIILEKLLAEAGERNAVYQATYHAFLEGQAGLLARELERDLQEKQEAVCPVCRTAFHHTDSHCFAELVEGTPEQKDVDAVRAAWETKEKEREECSRKIAEQKSTIKGCKESVIRQLREFAPDCPEWDVLDSTSYLGECIKACEDRKKKAREEYEKAEEQCKRLKNLKEKQEETEEARKACEERIKEYTADEQLHGEKRIGLEAALAELKKRLKYPDRESAQAQKEKLLAEKTGRNEKIRQAQESHDGVKAQCDATFGECRSCKDSLSDLETKKNEAEENLRTEIEKQGFHGMEEVHMLLRQAGETETEVEGWLRLKETDVRKFENEMENVGSRIKELERETKGQEKIDLEQLIGSIAERDKAYEEIQERLDAGKEQYKNHRSTADAVRDANQVLQDTENTWKRLNSLADLAVGTNAEGGKLSFDRHVMGYVFREVLAMANRRLDIMSGGRYELIHERSAGRNNAKAGLEITVLDMTTGKRRSVSSLSGGESFFVSLALALGLSDVVQNHAGGKRLDALFIDEGFGTLDNDVLEQALTVLNQLTEGQRLVGIISHVEKLKESIPQQIQVRNSEKGSFLEIVI